MTKSENNSSVLILVAVIGAAATIAAAVIGRGSGIEAGRQQAGVSRETVVVTRVVTAEPSSGLTGGDGQTIVSDATQVPETLAVPTNTAEPTNTPEPTIPPATPTPNITAAGTVLIIGQTWRGDGFDITMKKIQSRYWSNWCIFRD